MTEWPAGTRRRFAMIAGRTVHLRIAGSGPPVLLLHDSPNSSAIHGALAGALCGDFTVIAPDTPGNGQSEALVGRIDVPALAKSIDDMLDVLEIRRIGVYGFHTGAKLALELSRRRPGRVAVSVLDGLSCATAAGNPAFADRYLRPFEIDDDGAYLGREWTRLRDSARWYPWFSRDPLDRIGPAGAADAIRQKLLDYFSAGPGYEAVYRAAMTYDPVPALQSLAVPTVIMARSDDLLFPQLNELPSSMPGCCAIERLPADSTQWTSRVRQLFLRHLADRGSYEAPVPCGPERYVDLEYGQLYVRERSRGAGRPVLFLHEVPGGGRAATPFLTALAERACVVAPDLPGCGLSDPLPDPSMQGYADALTAVVDSIGEPVDLVAEYTATPLALALIDRAPRRIGRAVLDGVLLADERLRLELHRSYCPPLDMEPSGAFLHRAWHMLRDQQIHWPWYDPREPARRASMPQVEGWRLHQQLLDVLRPGRHYSNALMAALERDVRFVLARNAVPLLVTRCDDARHQWAGEAARLSRAVSVARRPDKVEGRVAAFWRFLTGRSDA